MTARERAWRLWHQEGPDFGGFTGRAARLSKEQAEPRLVVDPETGCASIVRGSVETAREAWDVFAKRPL